MRVQCFNRLVSVRSLKVRRSFGNILYLQLKQTSTLKHLSPKACLLSNKLITFHTCMQKHATLTSPRVKGNIVLWQFQLLLFSNFVDLFPSSSLSLGHWSAVFESFCNYRVMWRSGNSNAINLNGKVQDHSNCKWNQVKTQYGIPGLCVSDTVNLTKKKYSVTHSATGKRIGRLQPQIEPSVISRFANLSSHKVLSNIVIFSICIMLSPICSDPLTKCSSTEVCCQRPFVSQHVSWHICNVIYLSCPH